MTYFKLNDIDFSIGVNALKIGIDHQYKGRTNASGNTLVKYIATKRIIEVGIVPLDEASAAMLLNEINKFTVKVTYRDPVTEALKTINCFIPQSTVEYYTIRAGDISLKAFTLKFTEL